MLFSQKKPPFLFSLFSKNLSEKIEEIIVQSKKIRRKTSTDFFTYGGGKGTRTHDPLRVEQMLYQLSYASVRLKMSGYRCRENKRFTPVAAA